MQTVKASLELPPINKQVRWKVSTTLCAPTQNSQYKDFTAYSVYETANGKSKTHRFSPRSYLIIEPQGTKADDSQYMERTLYMDDLSMYKFKELLKELRTGFRIPSLYYYDGGILKLNKSLAKDHIKSFATFNKTVQIAYAVVREVDNISSEYEGIVIFVNNYSHAITFTALEMNYMIDTMDKLNMTEIGLRLITEAMSR